ncbi:hypothetical protein HPB50_013675 [Hyalomma asiaticum]|uniref:Uncharacterized protein n=1 Tax=Hyalomma asiaticum TaxID=266040 RepID=A0ACB7TM73_HYAAI|nr:hypothetical protein HPB50_013675 [Hyalomma asiaticum]
MAAKPLRCCARLFVGLVSEREREHLKCLYRQIYDAVAAWVSAVRRNYLLPRVAGEEGDPGEATPEREAAALTWVTHPPSRVESRMSPLASSRVLRHASPPIRRRPQARLPAAPGGKTKPPAQVCLFASRDAVVHARLGGERRWSDEQQQQQLGRRSAKANAASVAV